jgi:uncharacterized protein
MKIKDAAVAFLALDRIAVTGVSRRPETHGANVLYKRLRDRGYRVFALNPNADETMRQCVELGVKYVWMHRGPGGGSVSETATAFGREHRVTVIDGGCPLMFEPCSDGGHKVVRAIFTLTGKVPRKVA